MLSNFKGLFHNSIIIEIIKGIIIKIEKGLNILLFFYIFCFALINASFEPIESTIYFENKNTKEIIYYETVSYTKKSLMDKYFLKYLDNKLLGDNNIFNNWIIKEICIEDNCYNKGSINTSNFAISHESFSYDDIGKKEDTRDKLVLNKFIIHDLDFSEKFKNLYLEIFKSLGTHFILFLPFNLLIFFCLGYFIYIVFSKYIKINSYIFIYIVSFFLYLITFILLYYYGLGFENFNTAFWGFMSYFYIIGMFKLTLFLISRYTIEKYKKDNNIKGNFERNIMYFYLGLFIIFIIGIRFI